MQHEAEHARPRKKGSVMSYLAILFAAAFLLLLLSYFMQQRNSQETISGLKDSVSAMQSVANLIADNEALHQEVAAQESQIKRLEKEASSLEAASTALQGQLDEQNKALTAMDWLWRIQRAYSRGSKSDARTMVEEFEATGLPAYLPATALSGVDGPSPATQYDALLDALNYRPEA